MPANGEMPVPRPTIRDVAEHAGVSKSLVSLVLRGSPKVSPDRRAAVQRAIAELGYRPNAAARTLREGSSRAIGVLLNDVRHPWFIDLLDGLVSVVQAEGRHLVLSGGGRLDRRMDDSVLRGFLELEVDGFILAGTQANSPVIGEIANIVPTVTVGWRDIDLPRVDTVSERQPGRRDAGDPPPNRTRPPQDRAYLRTRVRDQQRHREAAPAGLPGHHAGLRAWRAHQGRARRLHRGRRIPRHRAPAQQRPSADRDLRRRRHNLPRRAVGRLGDEHRRTRPALAGRLRQLLPVAAAVDLDDQRRQRRLRRRRLAARTLLARVADPSRPAEVHLLAPTLQVRGSTAPPG